MQDRPDAGELLQAVRGFLETELLPALAPGRLAFQLRVAINALGVLERERALAAEALQREAGALAALLDTAPPPVADAAAVQALNAALVERLDRGDEPPDTLAVLARLHLDKLAVASPRTLAPDAKEAR